MGFRLISRIIGILSLVSYSVVALLLVILAVVIVLVVGKEDSSVVFTENSIVKVNNVSAIPDVAKNTTISDSIVGKVWFVMFLMCTQLVAILCLHIFESWKLIKGTEQLINPKEGLRCCRIWRGITIFFVLVQCLGLLFLLIQNQSKVQYLLPWLILPGLYIVKLCLVQPHMNNLERSANALASIKIMKDDNNIDDCSYL